MGINVFVALSLLTSVFDGPFPAVLPFIFQIAALSGFGLIWVNYALLFFFVEVRFWCSVFFLTVALMAVMAINVYIGIVKKLLGAALAFLGVLTVPVSFLSYFLVSCYVNGFSLSLPWLPIVPLESLYIVLVACIAIFGFSIVVHVEPGMLGKTFRIGRRRHISSMPGHNAHPTDDQKMKKEKGR